MDPGNWLRPDKDYEHMLESMTMVHYNDAQIAASDELFLRFTRLLAKRTDGVSGPAPLARAESHAASLGRV